MASSSGRGHSSDSVHQANLATFQSFRKTIDELTNNPHTFLGDHASLVKRIQEWRKTISHLTVWVTDDRAYYQQARPEIVTLLEAVFDSVRAVDTVRSQPPGSNWVRASEKEFESLLQDYIKLIEIAFPPNRQSRYNTPGDEDALNRGKILYNGLYSFKRRLDEVRGVQTEQRRASAPQLQQNPVPQQQTSVSFLHSNFQKTVVPPRAASHDQGRPENSGFQNGASAPIMRPFTQLANITHPHSLPAGSMVPMRPAMSSNPPMAHLVNGTQQLPQSPQHPTAPQGQTQVTAQSAPVFQNPQTAADDTTSAPPDVVPPEEQDWDLDIDWDELEALDRSEWQAGDPVRVEGGNTPLDPTPVVVEDANDKPPGALAESGSIKAPQVDVTSIHERGTLIEQAVGGSSGRAPSAQPKMTTPGISGSEVEDSVAQQLNDVPNHEPTRVLEHPESLAEDVIDIDELPGDKAMNGPDQPQIQKRASDELVSPALNEDVIDIQYSDDEMEVDELDPSEPPESIRESEQPDDKPVAPPVQTKKPRSDNVQPSTAPQAVAVAVPNQQSVNDFNSLPPHIRAEIRQKAKEPLIAHYLSISPKTREAAEARFQEMSDQEVFELYDKMGHARRVVDHYKNMLVQSSRKIHLPHIDVREPPPGPPTLLCSVAGAVRLRSETVEFSISSAMIASLERWRARFVTPSGSHGDLATVELACYPSDAFRPSEGKGQRELAPNAQTRTWPDGGILWGFINSEEELKDRNVRLFLSPPPFVELNQPVDISDFIREGRNTVKFVHLGGMEHFTFAVQIRRMPPPHLTWPGVLKRIQSLDSPGNGYSALMEQISTMLEER